MGQFVHPNLSDVPLASVLHALADPARLAMVRRLHEDDTRDGEGLSCSEGACPDLPRATMSNHYTVLRQAGLIESRKCGVRVLNRLRTSDVEARFPGVLEAILAAGQG